MSERKEQEPRIELGERFVEAVELACRLHRLQARNEEGVPYTAHLLAVAALVLEDGGDEDEAIAALLHDAAEDQGGRPTLEMIRRRFGENVAGIVEGCSDTLETTKPKWRPRKESYVAHLATASPSVRRVAAADKLHNLRSLLSDVRTKGAQAFAPFQKSTRDDQAWFYAACGAALQRAGGGPLARRVAGAARRLEKVVGRLNAADPDPGQGRLFGSDEREARARRAAAAVSVVPDEGSPNGVCLVADIPALADSFFDDFSRSSPGTKPRFVLFTGPIGAGKTRLRRRHYPSGYVVLDAADIFNALSAGRYFDFPDWLEEPMEAVGREVARRAVAERRHIVSEMVGHDASELVRLTDAVVEAGYELQVAYVHCDFAEAWRRNLARGDDNISAWFSQPYHFRWLLEAFGGENNADTGTGSAGSDAPEASTPDPS
jgi:GTP pyrophosphokinase